MFIMMNATASEEEVAHVIEVIEEHHCRAHPIRGRHKVAIGIIGDTHKLDRTQFEHLRGVSDVIRVSKPYKLVTRDWSAENSVVQIGDDAIGDGSLAMIAGPCAVESREQAFRIAAAVKRSGAKFFRGGAYKPRTSPYSFQGLGTQGLEILADIRAEFGLKIVTEAMDEAGLELVEKFGDVIQLGARNMQNFSLLKRAGRSHLPVLLKRGFSATLDEWLLAAEYIMAEGNYNVILCERGIRTFASHARNTLDLSVVPAAKMISHLPVVVDPSHGTGKNYLVAPLARAAVAVGADGLIIEVHDEPDHALCDGAQAMSFEDYATLYREAHNIHETLNPVMV